MANAGGGGGNYFVLIYCGGNSLKLRQHPLQFVISNDGVFQNVMENFDDMVFACGSGGTASGLSVSNYLLGSKLRYTCTRQTESLYTIKSLIG